MSRLTDIEDIKMSLVRGSVSIDSCLGVTLPLAEITFSLSDKENDRIYNFIKTYLKRKPKMQVYFVFKGVRKFARPFNISSYVAFGATAVARICSTVQVSCVMSEIMKDFPNDGFLEAVDDAEWDVRMVQRFGSRYIELREV